jgi:ATPase subunit of ABC transporter with duplicated ATPase domains
MKRKTAVRRVDIDLEELDRIIERSTGAPLSEAESHKLKTALHAMADRLTPKRSTEKTKAILKALLATPATASDAPVAHEKATSRLGMNAMALLSFAALTEFSFRMRRSSLAIVVRPVGRAKCTG